MRCDLCEGALSFELYRFDVKMILFNVRTLFSMGGSTPFTRKPLFSPLDNSRFISSATTRSHPPLKGSRNAENKTGSIGSCPLSLLKKKMNAYRTTLEWVYLLIITACLFALFFGQSFQHK